MIDKSKKSSVVFSLLDTPAFGGAEQYLLSHLLFLQQEGYSIVLATNNDKVKKEILSRLSDVQKNTFHIVIAPYRLDAIGNWKGLVKFFLTLPSTLIWCDIMIKHLKKEYDQVICLWPGFSDRLVLSRIAKRHHCPLLWIEYGPLEPTFIKHRGFPKFLYHQAEKYPDRIITISQYTKKSIIKNTSFPSSKISLIYPGISLKKTYQFTAATQRKKNGTTFGVLARLTHESEIDNVLKAFARLQKNQTTKHRLIIIGDGPDRKALEDRVMKLDLQGQVSFTGFVSEEEKYQYLSSLDFFIFPRAWELEGFGMTTIEALSVGVPVLVPAFGPQLEIISDQQEGYFYKPHSSKDLAEKMKMMTRLSTLAKRKLSEHARKRASDFSEHLSHGKMLSTIRSISDSGR